MKIIQILLIAFCATGLYAQKKGKKTPISVSQKAVPLSIDSLVKTYRFEEAALALQRELMQERQKKLPTEPTEQRLAQARMGEEMLQATERVQFIDSVVVDVERLLECYRLNREAGTLGNISALLTEAAAWKTTADKVAFRNELADRIYLSLPDTAGRYKIGLSQRLGQQWEAPQILKGLGSAEDVQKYPFVAADGVTLYFASQGRESLGGYDLFVTRYDGSSQQFLKAENLGMPFNSPANDFLYVVDETRGVGYFATDRNQPKGKVCVYTFIPKEARETYPYTATTKAAVRRAAMIHSIAESRTDSAGKLLPPPVFAEAPIKAKERLFIVINDANVYTSLTDFKQPAAVKIAQEWLKQAAVLRRSEERLSNLRRAYGENPAASLRKELAELETTVAALQKEVNALAKAMRKAELTTTNL